jgi:hypothetical protein
MNLQERELLTTFLQQMSQAQAGQKDAEADALIWAAVARQPEAAYLLVQRAMGLEYALQAAQAQAVKLQAELDQLRSNTRSGFLESPNSWGRSAPAPAQVPPGPAPQVPMQTAGQPGPAAARPASSWGSGMLGTVATTAAGVVAGSFLFQGIQGLMGHHNAGANATPLPPVSKEPLLDSDDVADALDESTDSAALDGGDFDSGDSA